VITIKEARKLLAIDRDDLDTAIMDQPVVYAEVALKRVEAESRRDRAKDSISLAESRAYIRLRTNAEKGTSETELKFRVQKESSVVEAHDDYRKHKEDAAQWLAVEEAFRQRGFMLRELARMWAAEHYESDSVSGQLKQHKKDRVRVQEATKAARRSRSNA